MDNLSVSSETRPSCRPGNILIRKTFYCLEIEIVIKKIPVLIMTEQVQLKSPLSRRNVFNAMTEMIHTKLLNEDQLVKEV